MKNPPLSQKLLIQGYPPLCVEVQKQENQLY